MPERVKKDRLSFWIRTLSREQTVHTDALAMDAYCMAKELKRWRELAHEFRAKPATSGMLLPGCEQCGRDQDHIIHEVER